MQFSEYRVEANKTAVYPERKKVVYPAIGLAGEAGEVCNQAKKVFRDDDGVIKAERVANLLGEAGAVYWYVAALANDLNITPAYRRVEGELTLEVAALNLAAEAGNIASIILDYADGDATLDDLRGVHDIATPLGYVLAYLDALCILIGSTPAECMRLNIQKPADRSLRGTLHGDGDNR